MDWMPQAVRDGVIVILVISGPLVLTAAFIGLTIGILQAATQVQEQTIGSALKIIGVFTLIIVAGFWMFQYLRNYAFRTITSAFTFVPQQSQKAVPAGAFKEDEFSATFEGEAIKGLKVIEPEKLEVESDLPEGGIPQGLPYLGAPEIPKPPVVKKSLPPTSVPKLPEPPLKSRVPLGDFQEPIPLAPPTLPGEEKLKTQDVVKPAATTPQQEDSNQQVEQIPQPQAVPKVEMDTGSENELSPSWLE